MPVSRMLDSAAPARSPRGSQSATVIGDTARPSGRTHLAARRTAPARPAWSLRSRRGMAAGAATLATGLSLATAAPVDAASSYCSPTGDYCTSVTKRAGVRQLTISTFSFRGQVDICVDALDGSDVVCKTRALKAGKGKAGDLYTATIKWSSNYPRTPKGKRKVTFQYDNTKLGPALTFTAG